MNKDSSEFKDSILLVFTETGGFFWGFSDEDVNFLRGPAPGSEPGLMFGFDPTLNTKPGFGELARNVRLKKK